MNAMIGRSQHTRQDTREEKIKKNRGEANDMVDGHFHGLNKFKECMIVVNLSPSVPKSSI